MPQAKKRAQPIFRLRRHRRMEPQPIRVVALEIPHRLFLLQTPTQSHRRCRTIVLERHHLCQPAYRESAPSPRRKGMHALGNGFHYSISTTGTVGGLPLYGIAETLHDEGIPPADKTQVQIQKRKCQLRHRRPEHSGQRRQEKQSTQHERPTESKQRITLVDERVAG